MAFGNPFGIRLKEFSGKTNDYRKNIWGKLIITWVFDTFPGKQVNFGENLPLKFLKKKLLSFIRTKSKINRNFN